MDIHVRCLDDDLRSDNSLPCYHDAQYLFDDIHSDGNDHDDPDAYVRADYSSDIS